MRAREEVMRARSTAARLKPCPDTCVARTVRVKGKKIANILYVAAKGATHKATAAGSAAADPPRHKQKRTG